MLCDITCRTPQGINEALTSGQRLVLLPGETRRGLDIPQVDIERLQRKHSGTLTFTPTRVLNLETKRA